MLFLDNAAPDSCCAERPLHIPTYPRLVSTAATVREKTCGETKSQTKQINRPTDRPTDPTDYNNPSLRMRARARIEGLIGRAGASPPSRTIVQLRLFLYPFVRRALNLLRASFSPIFQYFSAVNVRRVSFSPIIQYFLTCIAS